MISTIQPTSDHVPPSLLTLQSPVVVHDANIHPADSIQEAIDDAAYEDKLTVSKLEEPLPALEVVRVDERKVDSTSYKVIFSILGMTCASCGSSVTAAMKSVPGTTSVSVDLLGKTGSVIVPRKEDAERIRNEVEDVGFDCSIVEVLEQHDITDPDQPMERTITVRIDGMSCGYVFEYRFFRVIQKEINFVSISGNVSKKSPRCLRLSRRAIPSPSRQSPSTARRRRSLIHQNRRHLLCDSSATYSPRTGLRSLLSISTVSRNARHGLASASTGSSACASS